jgi:hypothetical protein
MSAYWLAIIPFAAVAWIAWSHHCLNKARQENPAFDTITSSFYRLKTTVNTEVGELRDGLFRKKEALTFAAMLEDEARKIRGSIELMPEQWQAA